MRAGLAVGIGHGWHECSGAAYRGALSDYTATDIAQIDREIIWLHDLIAVMEGGMIVTHDGVDVTARELAGMKPVVAYLEAVLLRLNHSINRVCQRWAAFTLKEGSEKFIALAADCLNFPLDVEDIAY